MKDVALLRKKETKGITLIALVITIIILLILAGVTIAMLTGENAIINKAKKSEEETRKQTATEILNLKITNTQIETYTKEKRMPTLKELAISLDPENDEEIQSLTKEKTKTASLEWIENSEYSSIFTILKEYPEYEFEINSSLQLASINGEQVENNTITETLKITENGEYDVKNYAKVEVEVPINTKPEFVSIYTSTYGIKNNLPANITINKLEIGQPYCTIVGRAGTGGANGAFDAVDTSFVNADYKKVANYRYNFTPTADTVTINLNALNYGPTYGSQAYAFVFKGNF